MISRETLEYAARRTDMGFRFKGYRKVWVESFDPNGGDEFGRIHPSGYVTFSAIFSGPKFGPSREFASSCSGEVFMQNANLVHDGMATMAASLSLSEGVNLRACQDCIHFREDKKTWVLWVPLFGWLFWLIWHGDGSSKKFAKCGKCHMASIDFITGTKTAEFTYCSVARHFDHLCGPDGKLFETKK